MLEHDEIRRPSELVPLALLILLSEAPGHGYELMDRLRDLGFVPGSPGRTYRLLRNLEERGAVRSNWVAPPEGGPARRVYEMTQSGRTELTGALHSLRELRLFVEMLGRRGGGSSGSSQ